MWTLHRMLVRKCGRYVSAHPPQENVLWWIFKFLSWVWRRWRWSKWRSYWQCMRTMRYGAGLRPLPMRMGFTRRGASRRGVGWCFRSACTGSWAALSVACTSGALAAAFPRFSLSSIVSATKSVIIRLCTPISLSFDFRNHPAARTVKWCLLIKNILLKTLPRSLDIKRWKKGDWGDIGQTGALGSVGVRFLSLRIRGRGALLPSLLSCSCSF